MPGGAVSIEDDAWQDVIERVARALAEVPAGHERDALASMLRAEPDGRRSLRVLPGGRAALLEEDDDEDDDDDDDESGAWPDWAPEPWATPASASLSVPPGGQQPLLRSAVVRSYRVTCMHGSVDVRVDGLPLATLQEGQTVDVDGATIDATNPGPERAEGWFIRL